MQKTILIVEDEPKLAQLLIGYMENAGYIGISINHGHSVIPWLKQQSADLILMDVMLPGRDGLQLCRDIRQSSDVPIFIISARVTELDRLKGLELGADDYICKPYSPREVVAKIKAFFRRADGLLAESTESVKTFSVDKTRMEIRYLGKLLDLTPGEYRLLAALLNFPGKVYSREALLNFLHEDNKHVLNRSVDTHIKNIRRKLQEISGDTEDLIVSVYGVGYKLNNY